MYANLKAEIARYGIKTEDIAKAMGVVPRTAFLKIKGDADFTLPEAVAIRDAFFPDCSLDYLFKPTQ